MEDCFAKLSETNSFHSFVCNFCFCFIRLVPHWGYQSSICWFLHWRHSLFCKSTCWILYSTYVTPVKYECNLWQVNSALLILNSWQKLMSSLLNLNNWQKWWAEKISFVTPTPGIFTAGAGITYMILLQLLLTNVHFLTWPLIGWQQCIDKNFWNHWLSMILNMSSLVRYYHLI